MMFGTKLVEVPGATPQERAQWLISNGWYQTSRKYRMLCRLPEGKTGVEALVDAEKSTRPWDAEKWAKGLGEGSAGDHFLRCHATSKDGLSTEVDQATFDAFRKLGGDTYASAHYRRARERKEATRVTVEVMPGEDPKRLVVELSNHFKKGTKIEDVKVEVVLAVEDHGGEPCASARVECEPVRT
jgi:hypothetical protein